MDILIRTGSHRLLYLADRLQREGHTVELQHSRDAYLTAWGGIFGGKRSGPPNRRPTSDSRREVPLPLPEGFSEGFTLSDLPEDEGGLRGPRALTRLFRGEGLEGPGAPLRLGGWWANGVLTSPHWVITEMGAWPGGGGRQVASSVALTALGDGAAPLAAAATGYLTPELPEEWTGLLQVEVLEGENGSPRFGRLWAGWPALHHQALLGQQPNALEALQKGPIIPPGVTFGTVLSIPPWPNAPTRSNRPQPLSPTLSAEARRQLIWHDVELYRGKLRTAGLDGFVALGVARCRFLSTARTVIREVATQLGLPELQLRSDAGEVADSALTVLERLGWID